MKGEEEEERRGRDEEKWKGEEKEQRRGRGGEKGRRGR